MDNLAIDSTEVQSSPVQGDPDVSDQLLHTLLGTVAEPDKGEPDSDGEPDGKPAKPTLNDLATKSGLSLDDLYKVTVGLPDEQGTATLQEIKNDATAFRKGQAQSAALVDEQTEFANEKLRVMQELQAVVATIPAEHQSDALKQQYSAYRRQHQVAQERILLEAIPSWQDQAVKAKDAAAMVALTQEYGLPAAALDQLTEAGWLKLVFDYTQLRQRIAGIKGKQKPAKARGAKSASGQPTAAADSVKAALAKGDKLGAMAALLQG